MRATYLTGQRIAMRAMRLDDKAHAAAWFDSPFPINGTRAEEFLRDEIKEFTSRKILLAIVRSEGEELIGGVRVNSNHEHADLTFHMAPWVEDADELRGEALGLLVRWLRDEGEHITVTAYVADDQPETQRAAEAVGMIQTARFREWYRRPGARADQLIYQALNPFWERRVEAGHA